MNTERERFEKWMRSEGYSEASLARVEHVDVEGNVSIHSYVSSETVALFVGWCARAREEALRIEGKPRT